MLLKETTTFDELTTLAENSEMLDPARLDPRDWPLGRQFLVLAPGSHVMGLLVPKPSEAPTIRYRIQIAASNEDYEVTAPGGRSLRWGTHFIELRNTLGLTLFAKTRAAHLELLFGEQPPQP